MLAHAQYVKSVPEADARLARAPTEVRVTFSESPEPKLSQIQVLDVRGERVDKGDLSSVDGATLKVSLTAIGDGGYTVAWRTTSAVDGHETQGSFAFAIGDAPLPALPDIPTAPPPGPVELLARVLSYAGVALLFGVPFFARFVARREEDRRGVSRLARAGAAAIIAGSALFLPQAGGLALVAGSRLGLLLAGRAALGALGVFMPSTVTLLGTGAIAAATLTLQSHAAAGVDPIGLALDYAHVLAISAWVGGLVALGVAALPRRELRTPNDAHDLGALIGRFSTLGLAAVSVIVATGAAQSLARLLDLRDLIETPYGLALLAKIVLLAVALAFGALNLLRHGPRLRAGLEASSAKRRLELGVRAEIALVAGILVAASVLTALSPPNYATGAAYFGVQHAGDLRIQLLVRSADPGRNKYDVRLQQGFAPPGDVEKVTLRFTMVEHDMGEQELPAQPKAAGQWVAAGSPTSMYGHWNVQVIVRRTGREDARALFLVPVEGGGGPAITTKAVAAGELTLFVYTDPPAPVAGQPLAIFVLPADRASRSVAATAVRAELEGRSYDGVAQQSVLWRIDLPAATAGTKTVTLVVHTAPGESRGTYDVTVAP